MFTKIIIKIYNLFKITNRFFCIVISKNFSAKNIFIKNLFFFFKFLAHDRIYNTKYYQKIKLIEFIKNTSKNKNSEFTLEIDKVYKSKNLKETLDQINEYGFSEKIKLDIEKDEPKNVVKYFDKADYYDGHIPFFGPKKKYNINPDSAYKSYDYETQLNNSTLLKICINENIIKLAERYLKCPPKIYSINTFKTIPQKKAFTHEFHRDLDNLKWLVVFIYWTKTDYDDGSFEQIKYTHRPSQNLNNMLKRNPNIFKDNFDSFFNETIPGYGFDKMYEKYFGNEIQKIFGNPGKVVVTDTIGLHRGTSVKKDRLVTWIRYGVIPSRQQIMEQKSFFKNRIKLNKKNQIILNESKFREVFSFFDLNLST